MVSGTYEATALPSIAASHIQHLLTVFVLPRAFGKYIVEADTSYYNSCLNLAKYKHLLLFFLKNKYI